MIVEDKAVRLKFQKCLRNYTKLDTNGSLDEIRKRRLPKICFDDNTKSIFNKLNEILSKEVQIVPLTIEKLHTITYCAARTAVELCQDLKLPVYEQSEIPKEFPDDEDEQKKLFKISPLNFKRLLFNGSSEVDERYRPTKEQVQESWSKAWKKTEEANEARKVYLDQERKRIEAIEGFEPMDVPKIQMRDLSKALKRKNWSPPGVDGIQYFWFKKFTPLKKAWLKKINAILAQEEEMPGFFTCGLTELFPKSADTVDPLKYRPITHLPVIYKIITRCIYQKMFEHYEKYGILADEQCGGRRGCYGVRKALVIDSVALDQQEVFGYYVDFKKAFDSVRHDWILELLKVYKVDEKFVKFLESAMKVWTSRIYLAPDIFTERIKIEKGVFHGDPISVILFWTAINPLSFKLRNSELALKLAKRGTISHLLYMDDLKLYASSEKNVEELFEEVKTFSKAINMGVNYKKTKQFYIPPNIPADKVYLGYIQKPKIKNDETIYHKVRKFEWRYKEFEKTKISDEDKEMFKIKFLFISIFNTFGVLYWREFKRELLKIEVKKQFSDFLKSQNDVPSIYLKLINDMCKMRRKFYKEMEKSEFMRNIVENDALATPLRLAITNEKEYMNLLIAGVKDNDKTRKRKISK